MNRKPIVQGDVLLIPATIPDTVTEKPRDNGQVILAYGEQTGHSHAIDSPDCTLVTAEQAGQLRAWLRVTAPVEVKHQEHRTVTIPPGEWEVIGQVEHRPEGLTRVAD
jgi:uncharacterized protein YjlB